MKRGLAFFWFAVSVCCVGVALFQAQAVGRVRDNQPDRGNDVIRREDAAKYFGKFLMDTFPKNVKDQKIQAEIEREKEDIQQEILEAKKLLQSSGKLSLTSDYTSEGGNTPLRRLMRLEYGWIWHPNEDRIVTITLDTADSGFGGGMVRSIFPNLLRADWSEKFYYQKQEWTLEGSAGGDQLLQTATSPGYPDEQDRIWERGFNQITLTTSFAGNPLQLGAMSFGSAGSGLGNLAAATVQWNVLQGYFFGNGTRVRLQFPTLSIAGAELESSAWGSSANVDAVAGDVVARIGKTVGNFGQIRVALAGTQFRQAAAEDTLWLSPTVFGWGVRNGYSMMGLSAAWRGFPNLSVLWESEWLLRGTAQNQSHEASIEIPLSEKVIWNFRVRTFESSTSTSWRGTPLPISRAFRVQSGVTLDIPSLYF